MDPDLTFKNITMAKIRFLTFEIFICSSSALTDRALIP